MAAGSLLRLSAGYVVNTYSVYVLVGIVGPILENCMGLYLTEVTMAVGTMADIFIIYVYVYTYIDIYLRVSLSAAFIRSALGLLISATNGRGTLSPARPPSRPPTAQAQTTQRALYAAGCAWLLMLIRNKPRVNDERKRYLWLRRYMYI